MNIVMDYKTKGFKELTNKGDIACCEAINNIHIPLFYESNFFKVQRQPRTLCTSIFCGL